jgi:hypothetical protein
MKARSLPISRLISRGRLLDVMDAVLLPPRAPAWLWSRPPGGD